LEAINANIEMTPVQWVLLCVIFTLYLLLGGSVFMYFEQYREIEKKEEISILRKDIKGMFHLFIYVLANFIKS